MTAALSKRHQARNERALQDLIKTVPGNDRCADCGARNPGWASWSLGIFLCMRCASLHRKLGTHISKVKSLSMDSWSNDQVDNMKRNGNVNTNRTFNPQNTKPSIPLDVDEVDAVLEKFIKQKYDQQVFSGGNPRPTARHDTGSTRSSEDQPPPLPPKPGKRFGFGGLRSASSALPLPRITTASPPRAPDGAHEFRSPQSPIRVNKQSRVFGTSVGGGGENMEAKLVQLRDMGFSDEKRNANILKGLGGNLERTIESLIRLGEGSAPASRSRTPLQARNIAVSQPLPSTAQSTVAVNGLSLANNTSLSQTNSGSTGQQSSHGSVPLPEQAMRSFSPSNPYQTQPQPYNPFNASNQQHPPNVPLENAFRSMQISQQPLFPNATGGYPTQNPLIQDVRYQTMTPPMPQLPQQYPQSNPFASHVQQTNGNYNPFYQSAQPDPSPTSNWFPQNDQPLNFAPSYNPYQQANTNQSQFNGYSTESSQTYSPQVQQAPFTQQSLPQQPFQQQPPNSSPQHSLTDSAHYGTQKQPQPSQYYTSYQPQPLQPQQTGRIDKSSILALYNYPQLAPPPLSTDLSNASTSAAAENPNSNSHPGSTPQQPQRSVTMPVQTSAGSRNPFQTATAAQPNGAGGNRHVSQESVDVGGFQNGRHSPDAFASLSARFVR